MRGVLLLMLVPAVFIYGWFVMKKLDTFLEENRKGQTGWLKAGGDVLKIGFADSFVADGISGALEQYSRQYPDVCVRLFYGEEEELWKKIWVHQLDLVFFRGQVDILPDKDYNRRRIILAFDPVSTRCGGLPVEPVTGGNVTLTAVWIKETEAAAAEYFMECMEEGKWQFFVMPTEL